MSTLPPEERESSHGREPFQAREMAESFGADPERYDRARPRYPEAIVTAIVAASPGREVRDVGCGTWIAARQFHAAGCTVLGVDVDERMACSPANRGSMSRLRPSKPRIPRVESSTR